MPFTRSTPAALLALAIGDPTLSAAELTLRLTSPADGAVLQAADVVHWSVHFRLSDGDNRGLALLAVDLVQDAANAGDTRLTPADTLAAELANFIAPAGVSNLVAGQPAFGGTPLGTECRTDLFQIGGGQNTTAMAGSQRGTSISVIEHVGHAPADLLLAAGSFQIGDRPGVYRFALHNAVAQVLDSQQAATPPWTVSPAAVSIPPGEDAITVIFCPGDVDQDASVDLDDMLALLACDGVSAGDAAWGACASADLTRDGQVDFSDLLLVVGNQNLECD